MLNAGNQSNTMFQLPFTKREFYAYLNLLLTFIIIEIIQENGKDIAKVMYRILNIMLL